MSRNLTLASFAMLACQGAALAQYAPPDPSGFQGLIVERYYTADANDAGDTDGSTELVEGATTYRVFADLKPGYRLITVGGFPGHAFAVQTTTSLFNNDDRGEAWGRNINDIHLDKNTVAIDSWLTIGAASDAHWGIPKSEDPDGSIVGGANNDGGSNGVAGGLLVNTTTATGIPLTTSDGLFVAPVPGSVVSVGTAPDMFDPGGSSSYSNDNFAWAVLGGAIGPDTANRILIGQFTTDGVLDFCLNLWLEIPDTLQCNDPNCHEYLEFYSTIIPADTAGGGFATQNRFTHPTLCFNSGNLQADCLGVPGGPAVPGTTCDDGNADTQNDVYDPNCVCLGEDCLGVLGGPALPGQPCDDGDSTTVNDTWQIGCVCTGVVGINDVAVRPVVTVDPNPTRDIVRIDISDMNGSRTQLTVRDALGQLVVTRDLGAQQNAHRTTIDLSSQPTGVYFLEVTAAGQRTVKRIVKF